MNALSDFLFEPEGTVKPLVSIRRSLRYFNLYRLLVASMFLLIALIFGAVSAFSANDQIFFLKLCAGYVLFATLFCVWPKRWRLRFNIQLTTGVFVDVLMLTLMMHQTGGARSAFGYMLLVALAGAGLVGQGRMTLFHAALATLALLLEQSVRVVVEDSGATDFFYAGLMSIGFFGSAASARLLASRVVANEALASRRGLELEAQLHLNQRVIRDMQDGVLVADRHGNLRQYNPQAAALFSYTESDVPVMPHLADFSVTLAERFRVWCTEGAEVTEMIRVSHNQRLLRIRFLPPGERGNALLYVEDMDKLQAQSQQIKLAALGRLAANMAHEIRNPLAAISHAAELMGEDKQDSTHLRLTRIISDNTQRLNRIVAEVLELGRRDRATVEVINLRFFLHMLVEELSLNQPGLDDIVAIDVDVAWSVSFDRGHLYRVLTNLLVNAMRYCSKQKASVRISAFLNEQGLVELHVIDDGAGVSDSLKAQVFEPFFTTHSGGTGLGLYIARELCEANGASLLLLDNAPGAHFCIMARKSE